jgi:hypothetical protein
MNNYKRTRYLLVVSLAALLAPAFAFAGDAAGAADAALGFGAVRGVTLDIAGKPLPKVSVEIRSSDGGTDLKMVSDNEGVFAADRLKSGPYQIRAVREGVGSSDVTTVEVAPNQTAHPYLLVSAAKPATATPAPPLTLEQELTAMKERIATLEAELKSRSASNATAPPNTPTSTPKTEEQAMAQAPGQKQPAGGKATVPVPPTTPALHVLPEALEAPEATVGVDNFTPFAYGDFTWLNGSPRNKDAVLDTKFFTPEIRMDTHFMEDFNQPVDHTMGGATESFRSGEFQVEQISFGGDFHWQNVRARFLTMNGLFASTTPRNDASAGVGQWDVRGAYKYVSEAYGGYHFNVNHGLNVDAGIFVSYIGLFSYYNFDNWTYQPSFVSSNTPWFFNGLRVQWFPTNKLKIEPWVINGWQSYNRFNGHRGLGGQILYRPTEWMSIVSNNYGNGTDTLGNPGRSRLHTDDSLEVRYYNDPESTGISKMAFSLTGDAGCEYGGGVTCHGGKGGQKQAFLGWMLYDRMWFHKDKLALTLGGGQMNNPGRYLTLLPPINGADAISGSPYFTANAGDKAHMWDSTVNVQYMPKQYITWWGEVGYRHSDVPYWTGRGGITPPGGNTGSPSQYVCASGGSAGTNNLATAYVNCGGPGSVWFPDLRRGQATVSVGVMVKF